MRASFQLSLLLQRISRARRASQHWGLSCALLAAVTFSFFAAACGHHETSHFPHVLHLTGLECGKPGTAKCLSCSSCHSSTTEERVDNPSGLLLCSRCHEESPARMERVLAARPLRPYGSITFDHGRHLRMKEIEGQCVPCHGGVVGSGTSNFPAMSTCFTCHAHQEQWERASCNPCHAQTDLEKTLPVSFLSHDQAFLRRHGSLSVTQEPLCKTCHSQSDCQACHDLTQMIGVDRRMPEKFETKQVHRGDFLVRHAIEARSEPANCMRCHEPASCDSCHVEHGVSGNALNGRNPHPLGWVGGNVASEDFHGRAARRDLLSCAGCHEAGPATNCIRCHKVGAYGGNPHPGGWRSARSTRESMCAYCHSGGL
jgi:hypothetical protein